MAQVVSADVDAARREFQRHEERERGTMPQYTDEVYLTPCTTMKDKSASMARILCYPILGLFGLHHFYLRRRFFGWVYLCTFGLFFLGWLIDWFRIGKLVKQCNEHISEARGRGHWIHSKKYPGYLSPKQFSDVLILWLPPTGLFGLHHFYLGRTRYGIFHACTLGFFGVGWIVDLFRLSYMVEKANTDIKLMKKGVRVGEDPYVTSDAYLLAIPLGLFGLHHFYLYNKSRGILFLCTLGVFGVGWLTDLVQMTLIVKEANKKRQMRERLQHALANGVEPSPNAIVLNVVASGNPGFQGDGDVGPRVGEHPAGLTVNLPEAPPPYRADAAEGHSTIAIGGETAGPSSAASHEGAAGAAEVVEGIPPKQDH
ncbi:uncharacterized protein [Diadema setosum]|uniref:uncharacterized protein n=1 Tax=Diadema setosum TaxID=31175 RepID=UPI003B3B3F6D